jgi:hypothetical protein
MITASNEEVYVRTSPAAAGLVSEEYLLPFFLKSQTSERSEAVSYSLTRRYAARERRILSSIFLKSQTSERSEAVSYSLARRCGAR